MTRATASIAPLGTVLGLDLATFTLGAAVWCGPQDYHARSISLGTRSTPLEQRWARLAQAIRTLRAEALPTVVVVEVPDLGTQGMRTTPATLLALFGAVGVAYGQLDGLTIVRVDARVVKLALAGRRTAGKEEVQRALLARGMVLPTMRGVIDHDAADALALCVWWQEAHDFELRTRRMQ